MDGKQATPKPPRNELVPVEDEYRLPSSDPRPIILAGILAVCLLLLGFGTWAARAPIASAVVANGEVVIEGNPKAVQHLEGGIVSEIHVEEGDVVRRGELLLRLDTTRSEAEAGMLRANLDSLLAKEARLSAELAGGDAVNFSEELRRRAEHAEVARIMADQTARFTKGIEVRNGKVAIFLQRIGQLHEQIRALEAARDSAARQIAIFEEELSGLRVLHEKGHYPLNRLRQQEREVVRLSGEVGSRDAEIARAEEAIGEARLQILLLEQNFREDVSKELTTVRDQIREVRERLIIAADTLARNEIRAPTSGMVQEIQVHTIGGVIAQGQDLMKIVPLESNLVIATEVSPNDIDRVTLGLPADVRFPALQARTTPVLVGEVTHVSQDRIEDAQRQTSFFRANVRLSNDELGKLGDVELRSGMPVQVFIRGTERTFFEYIMKPLTDGMARAFKEE